MNRRHFMTGLASSAVSLSCMSASEEYLHTENTFKRIANRCGINVGVQTSLTQLQNPEQSRFIVSNFNIVAAGNEFKWAGLRPTPYVYDFYKADLVVKYAQEHGLQFHGHNLCWNAYNPWWLEKTLNSSNAETLLREHITRVATRYAGKIASWDVVNEPVSWSGPGGMYNGPWLKALGQRYVDIAFDAARMADPGALRVLNVHHVEQDAMAGDQTRASALVLLERLISRNVPVQVVGLESHLEGALPGRSEAVIRFIEQIRNFGLQVMITELDVNDSKLPDDPNRPGDFTRRDERVAAVYSDYLYEVVQAGSVTRVIFFSISDANNWYDGMSGTPYTRDDGKAHRPSLLGPQLENKPVYKAVRSTFSTLCSEKE